MDSLDTTDASLRTLLELWIPCMSMQEVTLHRKEGASGSEQSSQECISPVKQLKKAVMSVPVLAYPDPNQEYLLKTDASELGLGAVLSQKQSNGRYHPVAFGSRALYGAEVQLPQYQTQVFGHEMVYQTFPDLLVGLPLQSLH